ncbi:MAG: helix-turn-helix domain-containing protein [Phycisphaerales bacterium]|nr:helix-turn-helix domain-containing protein [Phycisphaerales bacterium]
MTRTESKTTTVQKQVFTTGEAAELCSVSQQTIIRCFDQGRLEGFRVPGSKFRRIPRESLIRFMQANGMSTQQLEPSTWHVLLICDDPKFTEQLCAATAAYAVTIHEATSAWDAGTCFERWTPALVLLASEYPGLKACDMHVPDGTRIVECDEDSTRANIAFHAIADLIGQPGVGHSAHEGCTARSLANLDTYQGEVK